MSRTFEPMRGQHIEWAAREALQLAKQQKSPVTFTFNGLPVTVWPESNPAAVADDYRLRHEARRTAD